MAGGNTEPRRRVSGFFRGRICRAFLCLAIAAALMLPLPLRAQACSNCYVVAAGHNAITATVFSLHFLLRHNITQSMKDHRRDFVIGEFFNNMILPALQSLTHQLEQAAAMELIAIGSFIDAENQLETQLVFQELKARAHKDYQPSIGMCTIGTAARGLASAGSNAETVAYTLAERSLRRQLNNANTAGAVGTYVDKRGRLSQFTRRYCDSYDNGNGLEPLCGPPRNAAQKSAVNRDVDGGRLFSSLAYKVRYGNLGMDRDDPDLFALADNLYAHEVLPPVREALLKADGNNQINPNQSILLDIRAIAAKRAVAEDSFNQIAGMRALGTEEAAATTPQTASLLELMGYAPGDARALIDETPSYQARMELLTKKMYMDPVFYTNLYDKPANVERKGAALRAIGLMQDMDMFKSRLRSEMALSVLLELEIQNYQESVDNRMKGLRPAAGR
jgi:hypothetical protein